MFCENEQKLQFSLTIKNNHKIFSEKSYWKLLTCNGLVSHLGGSNNSHLHGAMKPGIISTCPMHFHGAEKDST